MMSVIGGTGTLFGPMAGARFVVLLRDTVNTGTHLWGLVMGAVFTLAVLAFRQGFAGPVWRRLKDQAGARFRNQSKKSGLDSVRRTKTARRAVTEVRDR